MFTVLNDISWRDNENASKVGFLPASEGRLYRPWQMSARVWRRGGGGGN